ncbi:MAG: hypothetical protein KDB14_17095 [Planctomycetales bacterium]|nr:hypothetical protein [Planctomycetales bacterium]
MDQLKPILAGIKTHRFWIVSGIVLAACIGTWYMETNRLREETKKQVSALDQQRSQMTLLQGQNLHPNPAIHKGMDQLLVKQYQELGKAWNEQYQRQEDVLVWPTLLEDDFINDVKQLKPIESKVSATYDELQEPLSKDLRDRYKYYIRDYLPKLADIVGAHWTPEGKAPEDKVILVDWNPSNQTALQDTRFSWSNTTPTTLEVLYAQEDMWVLTALLEIIRNVNGNIKGKYQAAIKEIDFLEIGPDAMGLAGEVQSLEAQARPGSGSGMGMGMESSMGMGMSMDSGMDPASSGSGSGGGGNGKQADANDPAQNRYVDKDFKPLPAKRLREAYDSEKPEDAIYAVAKRIPVRMRLTMDQRKVSRLLAECANYKMQLEVRQVRINCPSGSTFRMRAGGGGGGSEGGGEMSNEMMMDGGFGGGGGFGGSGFGEEGASPEMEMGAGYSGGMGGTGNQPLKLEDSSPWDVTVEIYGIILFYNPVAISKIEAKLNLPEQGAGDQPATVGAG